MLFKKAVRTNNLTNSNTQVTSLIQFCLFHFEQQQMLKLINIILKRLGNLKLTLQVDIRIRLSYRKQFIICKNDLKTRADYYKKSNKSVGITKHFKLSYNY